MRPTNFDAARHRPAHGRHRARRGASVLVSVVLVLALGATIALAGHAKRRPAPKPVVDSAHNTSLSAALAVDATGRTLYALSGETAHHLKCTTAQCLKFWPPLTVASARSVLRGGAGIKGKLGTIKRPGGVIQVTLRGLPLYRFLADTSAGSVNGQLIASFGGVWHAVGAASGVVTTPKTQTTTSSSSTSSSTVPGYPLAPTQVSSTATSSSGTPGAPTPAATTTATQTSATSATSTTQTSSATSTCTPYYIGPYYYPC
jgi:predicted lipoprotein with Yx(FWY)xxD motif